MKTYKTANAFIKAQEQSINWEDYMRIGGKVYKLYEYGGGSMMHMSHDYCYWVNKKTHDAIYLKYHCPSTQWEKIPETCEKGGKHIFTKGTLKSGWIGTCKKCKRTENEKVVKQVYQFISGEIIPNMDLWRTDTL